MEVVETAVTVRVGVEAAEADFVGVEAAEGGTIVAVGVRAADDVGVGTCALGETVLTGVRVLELLLVDDVVPTGETVRVCVDGRDGERDGADVDVVVAETLDDDEALLEGDDVVVGVAVAVGELDDDVDAVVVDVCDRVGERVATAERDAVRVRVLVSAGVTVFDADEDGEFEDDGVVDCVDAAVPVVLPVRVVVDV